MHKGMNKKKTTLLVVDGVCDILQEAVYFLFFVFLKTIFKFSLVILLVHWFCCVRAVVFFLVFRFLEWNVNELLAGKFEIIYFLIKKYFFSSMEEADRPTR